MSQATGGRTSLSFMAGGTQWSLRTVTRWQPAKGGAVRIPYASHYNPHGLAVGDINGDGENDVVIADYNSGLVVLYHNKAAGTTSAQANAAAAKPAVHRRLSTPERD